MEKGNKKATEKSTETAKAAGITKTIESTKSEKRFSKTQLLKSKAFYNHRDLLSALLEEGESYTKAEAKKLIDGYLKREVS